MYLTGFADEASRSLDGQIKATQTLGWRHIESRAVDGVNIHDLPEKKFDRVCGNLQEAGIKVNCFGSAVANWAKKITEPFDSSLQEARRAIPRMERLGVKLIRIMSFAVLEDKSPDNQMEAKRFSRLRELQKMFQDAGITPVHENCMNYGGMGWPYTLKLIDNVPGLKLVFDTGNPVFNFDRSKSRPWPRQSVWEFYQQVREHIAYIHIKDAIWDETAQKPVYTMPGEGQGQVKRILQDMLNTGYDGGISIEPHLAVVFHNDNGTASQGVMFRTYVEYGRKLMRLLLDLNINAQKNCPELQVFTGSGG